MSRNTVFTLILLVFGTLTAATLYTLKKGQNTPFGGSKMAQELVAQTGQVHDEAVARIKADFAVPQETWDQFMGSFEQNVQNDDLLGSGPVQTEKGQELIITTVQDMLREYGVNPARVAITLVASSDTPCQALQTLSDNNKVIHKIELNLKKLNKYKPEVQKALLRHEIMHLLNYDSLEGSYIITMLYQLGHSRQKLEKHPAMIAFRHQRELRADALASCDHPEVAQGLQEFFAEYMKVSDQDNPALWTLHPSDKTRHTQLAQLLTQMGTNVTTA